SSGSPAPRARSRFSSSSTTSRTPPGAPTGPGRWWLGLLLRRSRSVAAVSRALATRLEELHPRLRSKVSVVPNGAAAECFAAAPLLPEARPFLLCVARLSGYKGIDLLLMAFSGLAQRRPELDLVLCGPDHQSGHHQRLATALGLSERVRFLGEKGPEEVRDL